MVIENIGPKESSPEPRSPLPDIPHKFILGFLFFLSGIAGLAYEVAWSRYLSLVLGNTTQAHMVVLAAFLAGLALGNYAFGKWSRLCKNPLVWYGFLELGIAAYCAFYPFFHRWAHQLYFNSGYELTSSFGFRAALSSFLLIFPTFLMGGTFPVLIRCFVGGLKETQRMTGILYAVNSFGAVIGSAASSLWLIQSFGLDSAILIGSALSGASGAAALLLAPNWLMPPLSAADGEFEAETVRDATLFEYRWMIGATFLSGFTALVLEIVWFRFFALILGSTLYSFSLMLSAFILGITIGSIFSARRFAQSQSPQNILRLFGYCQIAFGAALILSFPFYPRLPYYFLRMAAGFKHAEQYFWAYQTFTFGFCFLLMLVPTVFSGAALPVASQWISLYRRRPSEGVGIAFSANLLGTLAGSAAAGLLFLPRFGIEGALKISSLMALCSGLISTQLASRKFFPGTAVALAVAVFATATLPADWRRSLVLMNPYYSRGAPPPESFERFINGLGESKILYYKDGAEATVAVLEHAGGERVLKINGKTDASALGDLATELLLGHLPMILRPARLEAETRALCIGFGSGISAGAVLQHPGASLDLVEISPEVMEASGLFDDYNHNVMRNPLFHLTIDDAKSFLAKSKKKYDVIVSEPSNPRTPGNANLFTREFFELCGDRLTGDGLMVQWFHLYLMTDEVVQMILRTFQTSFPHTYIWNTQGLDMMVIGSRRPLEKNFGLMKRRMDIPSVRADLARIGIADPVSLMIHEILSGPAVEQIAGLGRLHTDFYPQLEFGAAKSQYLGSASLFLFKYDQRKAPASDLMLARYLNGRQLTRPELRGLLNLWMAEWHKTQWNASLMAGLASEIERRSELKLTQDSLYLRLKKRLAERTSKTSPAGFLFTSAKQN